LLTLFTIEKQRRMIPMILIVGASGHVGGLIVQRLLAQGMSLRLMSRHQEALAKWSKEGVEIVQGDVRDPHSLNAACQGVTQVITTAHASEGTHGNTPLEVDLLGNRALIAAAKRAGVEHFVFTSTHSAQPDSPRLATKASASVAQNTIPCVRSLPASRTSSDAQFACAPCRVGCSA